MKFTLDIDISNNKALAFIEYIKSLDFIEISKTTDWYDELNFKQKESINKGIEDLENGNTYADEDVRKDIHQRITNAQSK